MTAHQIVSGEQWLAARRSLLQKEKAFTRLRDELSAERRALPWVKVEKPYVFDGPAGKVALAELFAGCSQLAIYHFMLGPDWEEGCRSCSFWADQFDALTAHLKARDVSLAAVSRAPYAKIASYKQRMGWRFPWVSSADNDFNRDFAVSFTPQDLERPGNNYNFATQRFGGGEAPGLSVLVQDGDGIYRTYSCYARGLDMLNATYQVLDLVPKGRDEGGLEFTMAWVRRHDEYADGQAG